LALRKRFDVGNNIPCDSFSARGRGKRSLVFVVGRNVKGVHEVSKVNILLDSLVILRRVNVSRVVGIGSTKGINEIVMVIGKSRIEED